MAVLGVMLVHQGVLVGLAQVVQGALGGLVREAREVLVVA